MVLLEMNPLSKNKTKQKKKKKKREMSKTEVSKTVRMYQVKIISVLQIQYYGPVLTKKGKERVMKIRSKNKGNPKCTF